MAGKFGFIYGAFDILREDEPSINHDDFYRIR